MGVDKLKAAGAAATVGAVVKLVKVTVNEQHNEIDRVAFAGIPLFKRDEKGNPRILGIPFRRRRGPRIEKSDAADHE